MNSSGFSHSVSASRWFAKTPAETLAALHSGEHGLSEEEARRRLQAHGPNRLPEVRAESLVTIFLRQFQSPLIYVLVAASFVVFALRQLVDGFVILFVLLFNAVTGTIQEGRAQTTLRALKKFVATSATVLREGKECVIPDHDVVPGDVILLQEGERVPADARLIASNTLTLDESALTGESGPVHKVVDLPAEVLAKEKLFTAEQRNIAFKGTYVLAGNGRAAVIATGGRTVIGEISEKIAAVDTEIPLKANIRHLSRLIIVAVALISTALFLFGVAGGKSLSDMFTTVVALSVSIIPEGLPIVMTLVLATGMWRMSRANALVRKLQAVEALGQARVIAVDKTGTITANEMVIQKVYAGGKMFEVGGIGYEPRGEVALGEAGGREPVVPADFPELLLAGKVAALCAHARLSFVEETGQWRVAGDPTDAAMRVFAEKIGFPAGDLERMHPLIQEIPFTYAAKYHATVHAVGGKRFWAVVGAPEAVLSHSRTLWQAGKARPLTPGKRKTLETVFREMSRLGLRVIGFGMNPEALAPRGREALPPLTFVGFYGMKDALRPEVQGAIARAHGAGIRVVMITGDHRLTAEAVAREAGILREGDGVLTGEDIERLSDRELAEKIPRVSVFARVTPEHKMSIIQAYRRRGEVVAMTGDGVNDAPSLVAADLGIAMGRIGTEVAKEAADIVILDDNFGSIITAVEEGRSIYKTIKKVILYLFSTSIGEVLTIAGALFLGYPLPILAAQIIWLNLVTDGFLDVALAMEPKEPGLLAGRFERPKKYLIDALMSQRMFTMALPMMAGTLLLFSRHVEADLAKAWTVSLTTLAVFQWCNAWNCRSETKSVFQMNPFANKFLLGATITIILLQLAALYAPVMQRLLRTVPLALSEWLVIIPVALSVILVEEIRKFANRRMKP